MWGFDETLGQGVAGVIHTDGTSAVMVGVASGVSSKIDIVLKGKDSMTWHSVGGSSDGRILGRIGSVAKVFDASFAKQENDTPSPTSTKDSDAAARLGVALKMLALSAAAAAFLS